MTGNHELARKGVERRTGELQKREQEADEQVCSGPIYMSARGLTRYAGQPILATWVWLASGLLADAEEYIRCPQ